MNRITRPLVLALALVVAIAAPARAGDDEMTAQKIVDQYVAKTRTAEKLAAHDAWTATGSFNIAAQGLNGSLTVRAKAPNMLLVEVEVPGIGTIHQGFDGEHAWSMDPMQGPQVLTGKAAAQLAEQAEYTSMAYGEQTAASLARLDDTTFEGASVYAIEVTSASGLKSIHYFSQESGMLVGKKYEQHTPMGPVPVTQVVGEHAEWGGMLLPATVTDRMMGMEQAMGFDSYTFEDLDEALFALPPEVAKMVENSSGR